MTTAVPDIAVVIARINAHIILRNCTKGGVKMSYEDYLEAEISSHENEFEDEREMRQAYREALADRWNC